jgi:hypothetical protein
VTKFGSCKKYLSPDVFFGQINFSGSACALQMPNITQGVNSMAALQASAQGDIGHRGREDEGIGWDFSVDDSDVNA